MLYNTISDILSLTVPQYAFIPIITTLMLFFVSSTDKIIPPKLIIAIGLYIAAVLAFNLYNMAFDGDIDKINKPNRPIPAGRISAKKIICISSLIFIVTFVLGFIVNFWLGLVFLLFYIEAILYSTPPIRLRKYFLFHNINAMLIFAICPIVLVFIGANVNIPLPFSLYIVLLLFCSSMIKDFEDIKGEKKIGIKTIPNVFGIKKASLLLLVSLIFLHCYLLLMSLLIRGWQNYILPSIFGLGASICIFVVFYNFVPDKRMVIHSKQAAIGVGILLIVQLFYLITSFFV